MAGNDDITAARKTLVDLAEWLRAQGGPVGAATRLVEAVAARGEGTCRRQRAQPPPREIPVGERGPSIEPRTPAHWSRSHNEPERLSRATDSSAAAARTPARGLSECLGGRRRSRRDRSRPAPTTHHPAGYLRPGRPCTMPSRMWRSKLIGRASRRPASPLAPRHVSRSAWTTPKTPGAPASTTTREATTAGGYWRRLDVQHLVPHAVSTEARCARNGLNR